MRTSVSIPKDDDLLQIQDAVTFLMPWIKPTYEDLRQAKDKLRKRIVYAIEKGKLASKDKKLVRFGDLIAWGFTKKEWRNRLQGLPVTATASVQSGLGDMVGLAVGTVLPSSEEGIRQALFAANLRIVELIQENQSLRAEIARLQPYELRDIAKREIGEKFGKKARGVSKK